ncbi:hypothetical protein QFC24_005039 [Naganishia onofrii]|uniref:Uncharacterized protein n=1 Tax=Naganishia onofrii TaxID=1851511 RepID=A0ACC2XAL5_9TREE|nr:hypothetical protein QFC24_005039 [Naganishia onofrii]
MTETKQDLVAEKIVMTIARSTTPVSTTTAPIRVIIEALIESLLDGYLSATTSAILCRELVLRLPSASYPPVSGGNHFRLELAQELQGYFDKEWKLVISSSTRLSNARVDLTSARGPQYDQQSSFNLQLIGHDYSQMHIPIANIFKADPQFRTPCWATVFLGELCLRGVLSFGLIDLCLFHIRAEAKYQDPVFTFGGSSNGRSFRTEKAFENDPAPGHALLSVVGEISQRREPELYGEVITALEQFALSNSKGGTDQSQKVIFQKET